MNRFFFAAAALAASAVACSGADNILLGDSGAEPVDDGSVVQNDAASPAEDATSADASSADVEHPKDANVVDVVVDHWTGPPDSKIQCGPSTTCSAQNEICCWHQSSTTKQFECVTSPASCAGTYDVTMTCSSTDNCASQGHGGYQCCATGGNLGWGSACSNYDVASSVTCKSQCDTYDYELGCSVQQQNCSDPQKTCVVSKCTAPSDTMCY